MNWSSITRLIKKALHCTSIVAYFNTDLLDAYKGVTVMRHFNNQYKKTIGIIIVMLKILIVMEDLC